MFLSYFLSPHQLAVADLAESVKGADILIFVIPHQFIVKVCDTIKDHIKKDAIGMSLIKVIFFLSLALFISKFFMHHMQKNYSNYSFQ